MRLRRLVIISAIALSAFLYLRRSSGPTEEERLAARGQHVFTLEGLASSPAGRLDDLGQALAIADRNRGRWEAVRFERAHRPLADYPEGDAAIAALGRWARSHDAVPPMPVRMSLFSLAKMAIETATPSAPAGVETAQLVGHRFLMNGLGVMDGMIGANLLELAADRARALGLPATTWWVPPRTAFARVLAAEALWTFRMYAPSSFADRALAFWAEVLADADHQLPMETLAKLRSMKTDEFLRTGTAEELATRIVRLQARP